MIQQDCQDIFSTGVNSNIGDIIMNEEVYSITDINGYANEMRTAAANSISDCSNDNLDDFITITQISNLVKQKCLGYDDLNRPMLNESINENIYEEIAIWIHSVGLARLAAQDLVECAWDNDSNEMVFWTKESKIKKEKKPNAKRSKPKSRRKNMGDKE